MSRSRLLETWVNHCAHHPGDSVLARSQRAAATEGSLALHEQWQEGPSPFETARFGALATEDTLSKQDPRSETLRRYAITSALLAMIPLSTRSIAISGSLAYGGYFTVTPTSDVDLLVLLESWEIEERRPLEEVSSFPEGAVEEPLATRLREFEVGTAQDLPRVLVHSVILDPQLLGSWGPPFRLDLRFVSSQALIRLVSQAAAEIAETKAIAGRVVEHRNWPVPHQMYDNNFLGESMPSVVELATSGKENAVVSYVATNSSEFRLGPFGAVLLPRLVWLLDVPMQFVAVYQALAKAMNKVLVTERRRDPSSRKYFFLSHVRSRRIRHDVAIALEYPRA